MASLIFHQPVVPEFVLEPLLTMSCLLDATAIYVQFDDPEIFMVFNRPCIAVQVLICNDCNNLLCGVVTLFLRLSIRSSRMGFPVSQNAE